MGTETSRIGPEIRQRADRRARRRILWGSIAKVIVIAIIGAVLLVTDGHGRSSTALVFGIFVVVIAGTVGLQAWALRRTRRRRGGIGSPWVGVDRRTRRRLARAIRNQEELHGQDRELALAEARRIHRVPPIVAALFAILMMGLAGLSIADEVARRDQAGLVRGIVFAVFILAALGYYALFYRRTGAYLRRYDDSRG